MILRSSANIILWILRSLKIFWSRWSRHMRITETLFLTLFLLENAFKLVPKQAKFNYRALSTFRLVQSFQRMMWVYLLLSRIVMVTSNLANNLYMAIGLSKTFSSRRKRYRSISKTLFLSSFLIPNLKNRMLCTFDLLNPFNGYCDHSVSRGVRGGARPPWPKKYWKITIF